MHVRGEFEPADEAAVLDRYEDLGGTAQVVVTEVARAMDLDRETYRERVDASVVETARNALFAESLAVTVGGRAEYETWREGYDGEVHEIGSDAVDRVVWHAGPGEEAVAATFQTEEDAAVGTLRRHAFGRLYRPLVE